MGEEHKMKDDKNTENVEKNTANKIHCSFKAFLPANWADWGSNKQ